MNGTFHTKSSVKFLFSSLIFILISTLIFPQAMESPVSSVTVEGNPEKETVAESVQLLADATLAMSVPNYPVTAGDVYSLAFAAGSTPVHYTIPVDTSYKIRVANLGVITCAGMTYNQLKAQVEYLVSQNYPFAGTQFVLTRPAVFLVSIVGEVKSSVERKAWALTRLSAFISSSMTDYSSIRKVTVVSANGKKKTFDLYAASRSGDFSQDPYLRPSDKIEIGRVERKVSVYGAVEREGTYELLQKENLKELIESYANGVKKTANLSQIRLVRLSDENKRLEKVQYLTENDIKSNFELCDRDKVYIADWSEWQPFVELKGIIKNPLSMNYDPNANGAENSSIYRIKITFYVGEDYASLIRRIKNYFTLFSDLKGMYIERDGKEIILDADKILQDLTFKSPYIVEKNDVIIVPYLPVFVN